MYSKNYNSSIYTKKNIQILFILIIPVQKIMKYYLEGKIIYNYTAF